MSTSFQLVSCKMFIAFLWSKSKRCFVSLLCACFSSVSFLQKQGNSISNLYLIWTNDEFVKQKSFLFLDERLSLVCLYFTLFTLRFFTQWNKFQTRLCCFRLRLLLCFRFNAKLIEQVLKTFINTGFRLKQYRRAKKASIRVNNIDRKFIAT